MCIGSFYLHSKQIVLSSKIPICRSVWRTLNVTDWMGTKKYRIQNIDRKKNVKRGTEVGISQPGLMS